MVINDILDTSADYVLRLKAAGLFVVNFEDFGPGIKYADLVINALYSDPLPGPRHLSGPDYVCLRDEFFSVPPKRLRPEVRRVLVTFGGVDIANLTAKVLRALERVPYDFTVTCILSPGYSHTDELRKLVASLSRHVIMKRNIRSMSEEIYRADLVFTSAGRTVYEIASVGVPCVVLAQNAREMTHMFASSANGIVNLGLGADVSEEQISQVTQELIEDFSTRQEMQRRMLSTDLREGINRVIDAIFRIYRTFESQIHKKGIEYAMD
ncbi:MAG: hypothetical protein DRP95_06525 [Candidatus Latescibacterota bacterium]|nr:MAG: hypothetical protein DRP95_06525 [Candidatus Latescibacterota bacterium]